MARPLLRHAGRGPGVVQAVGDLAFDLDLAFGLRVQAQDAVPQPDRLAPTSHLPIGVAQVVVDFGVGRFLLDRLLQGDDGGVVIALLELGPAQGVLNIAVLGLGGVGLGQQAGALIYAQTLVHPQIAEIVQHVGVVRVRLMRGPQFGLGLGDAVQ